jgi:hypothetical protein
MDQFNSPLLLPAQDWEGQRARIQELYNVENRSLNEVREIMEKEKGFKATYVHPSFRAESLVLIL